MKDAAHSSKNQDSWRIDLAYVKLASSEMARDINRDIVLELIRSSQPVGRAELARVSGLQPSTISAIAEQLLEEGWITEGAAAKRPRGRRPTMLTLNSELVMLAADLRPGQAILAVVDLNGRFLSRESVPLASDAERATVKIAEAMEAMRRQHPDKTFEGVGISVPGRVHPDTQRIILAPNLHWGDFDLKKALTERLKLQVELENAANACLLSELWFGRMDGVRNAVLITVSEGVGSAILANGQILAGRSGLAGEFGHIPIDPNGPVCGCGQRGCWETFASSKAALRYYAELEPEQPATRIQELLKLGEEEDPKALKALERQARALGRGLRLVTSTLSPEVVLIIGDITSSWSRIAPLVEQGDDGDDARRSAAATGSRLRWRDGTSARSSGAGAPAALRLLSLDAHHRQPPAVGKGLKPASALLPRLSLSKNTPSLVGKTFCRL